MKKTFILLLLSHIFVDFFIGIWPIYKTLASIDIAQAGLIMGIVVFIAELLQVGFGFLGDRGHQKKLIVFGLLASSTALFLTFSSSLWGVLTLMLTVMIGSSSFHPSSLGLSSQFSGPKNDAILLFSAFGTLGYGLSQIIFMKFTHLFGGHAYPLLIPLLILLVFWLFHRMPEQTMKRKPFSLRDFFAPFIHHKRSFLLLYMSQALCYGVFLASIFLLPDLLRFKNSSEWLAWGGGHLCLILGSMIGALLFSSLSEKIGYKTILLGSIPASFVLLNIFLFSPLPPDILSIPLLAVLGAALYLSTPIAISWANKLVPDAPSTVSGLMGIAWALSSLIPALAGLLASLLPISPYITALYIISLFLIPSFFCIMLMPKTEKAHETRVYN